MSGTQLFGSLREHQYLEGKVQLPIDGREHLSLILSYKRGELEPDFVHVDQVTASLGVLF